MQRDGRDVEGWDASLEAECALSGGVRRRRASGAPPRSRRAESGVEERCHSAPHFGDTIVSTRVSSHSITVTNGKVWIECTAD